MENKNIKARNIIQSKLGVSSDQGQKIFKILASNVSKKIHTTIYFDDIDVLTTAFLNTAIGNLYATANNDTLNQYITISPMGISKSKLDKIKLVMENSRNRLTKEETDKEIFDND